MTLIFFGSSEFSLAALKACLDSSHQILLVITTPDKKQGRGLKLMPTPVRRFAEEKRLPVEAFPSLKDIQAFEKAKNLNPDFFVVSSYGKLIPSNWLKIPSQLALNVHPSLLPKYRGAAPINWPIINGDIETGVSIAEVTEKLDSGDIFLQEKFPLDSPMNSDLLTHQLAERSYHVLLEVFKQIKNRSLKRLPQMEEGSSYARKLTKEDGQLSLQQPAKVLERWIRGLQPWPGGYIFFQKEPLHILEAEAVPDAHDQKPGTLIGVENDGTISIMTGEGLLKVKRVRPAGKKDMTAADFIRGRRLQPGFVFEPPPGVATL